MHRLHLLSLAASFCCLCVACGSPIPTEPKVSITSTQNPLVAQYSLITGCSGQAMVDFGPDTSYGRSTSWFPAHGPYGTTEILVAGMKAGTTYHMRSHLKCGGSSWTSPDQTFTTGPLPSTPFPALTVTRPNPSLSSTESAGIELLSLVDITGKSGMIQSLFTDRDGNPIWYYDTGVQQGYFPATFKLLSNTHLIFSIAKGATFGTILREIDLAGNTIREMDMDSLDQKMQARGGFDFVPMGYHHDFLPLANGHLIVLVNFYQNFTDLRDSPGTTAVLGDGLVDLDPDWNPVWAWSAFDHLDVNRHLQGLPDWTHANAVIYSPSDGNLLLSMRHQSWIAKIDYSNGAGTGNVLWKLGYEGDFTLPSSDPSQWFSFQHFPSLLDQNGSQDTLAVWDNGDNRPIDNFGDVCSPAGSSPCYSRGVILQIDESTKAASIAWEDLPGPFSLWGGSINQLASNNIEFDINALAFPPNPSLASQVQEVTQTAPPQLVWQMDINTVPVYAYRAYRVPSLYPGISWNY
jgi:arylsulfate sulfotransferase